MSCKKAKGPRSKSRDKMKRHLRSKTTVNALLRDFKVGSRVQINLNPAIHSGLVKARYQGVSGIVLRKQGAAFVVGVHDLNKAKKMIVGPAHLKELF